MKTAVSSTGRIVLPRELRRRDGIEPGDEFRIERLGRGRYLLSLEKIPANQGLVAWLLSCPEKDWFTPIESEIFDPFIP